VSHFVEQVAASILERKLIRNASGILIAVSGGLDSMVLLHVLARLAERRRWRLVVTHFNHRLRGRSSDADERLVATTARNLGLRFVRGEADVRRHAERRKLSVEMAARELRHAFLARTARRSKISTIALAHHADDQVELFFVRLLRGAGSEGLAGMKWRNESPADRRVTLVRPLLDRSKDELRTFAKENRIAFREDATNAQLDFQRNRIRHELLPLLRKKYQPALTRVILRQMEILGAEGETIAREASRAAEGLRNIRLRSEVTARQARRISNFKFQISDRRREGRETPAARGEGNSFSMLPVAVQRRCLEIQAVEQGVAVEFELIETLREEPEKRVTVGASLTVWRDDSGQLHVQRGFEEKSFGAQRKILRLGGPGIKRKKVNTTSTQIFDNVQFTWRILPGLDGIVRAQNKQSNREFFDADKVGVGVVLRHWQPGDRFQPIGMPSAVKLQDLFINAKVPADLRHKLIIGATQRGEIFWVEGLRMGERFKLDKTTVRWLQWSWKRLK
jgi:tRNA(Ile)-lysidine synthase